MLGQTRPVRGILKRAANQEAQNWEGHARKLQELNCALGSSQKRTEVDRAQAHRLGGNFHVVCSKDRVFHCSKEEVGPLQGSDIQPGFFTDTRIAVEVNDEHEKVAFGGAHVGLLCNLGQLIAQGYIRHVNDRELLTEGGCGGATRNINQCVAVLHAQRRVLKLPDCAVRTQHINRWIGHSNFGDLAVVFGLHFCSFGGNGRSYCPFFGYFSPVHPTFASTKNHPLPGTLAALLHHNLVAVSVQTSEMWSLRWTLFQGWLD